MDMKIVAEQLNGNQYGNEGSKVLFDEMKLHNLVAVFGASDDLMEFRGTINDELPCFGGGEAFVNSNGLFISDCSNDRCPHEQHLKKYSYNIQARWDVDGFSWKYETDIPHEKFVIHEGDDLYCEGIVFCLDDLD